MEDSVVLVSQTKYRFYFTYKELKLIAKTITLIVDFFILFYFTYKELKLYKVKVTCCIVISKLYRVLLYLSSKMA